MQGSCLYCIEQLGPRLRLPYKHLCDVSCCVIFSLFITRSSFRMHPLHDIWLFLKAGLYTSARQTSKFIFSKTCIHVLIFTNLHEYDDNLYLIHLHLFANLYEYGEKFEWHFDKYTHRLQQIQRNIMTNLNDTSKQCTWRWQQIYRNIMTNRNDKSDESTWRWLQINIHWLLFPRP